MKEILNKYIDNGSVGISLNRGGHASKRFYLDDKWEIYDFSDLFNNQYEIF